MCKASMAAEDTREAETGDRLVLSRSDHFLPILRRPQDGDDYPTCVRLGRQLTISNIPIEMQMDYRLGESEQVTFVEEIDDTNDCIMTADGRIIDLSDFLDYDRDGQIRVEVREPLNRFEHRRFVDRVSGRSALEPA